ncbi:MAG: RluA family pseudouridine synthase [Oscillospiraceae bacterium]|nr:RluA family pseudouridine synthase [Oscillospiraceae bacterium]
MENLISFKCENEDIAKRVDKFLSEQMPDKTRSFIQKIIEDGAVICGNKILSKNYKLRQGDVITVDLPELQQLDLTPQNLNLDIVYEDNDLLVVNKPKGLVVHPAPGNYDATLVHGLLYHCGQSLSGINGVIRPGIVHRIDKDTSGLLIVAKSDLAHIGLSQQIKQHSFTREYRAIVHGVIKQDKFTIDLPIGRSKNDRKKMCVTRENSREAVTHVEVLERYANYTYIKCVLETGRTHQIRVHMSNMHHPIAGDPVYGPKKAAPGLNGQCLHAKKIGFEHPITNEHLEFDSDLPQEFIDFKQKAQNGLK